MTYCYHHLCIYQIVFLLKLFKSSTPNTTLPAVTTTIPRVEGVPCVLVLPQLLTLLSLDPEWNYLQIRLTRCSRNQTGALPRSLSSKWSGKCVKDDEIDAVVTNMGFNVWFRFEEEEFENDWELKKPKGIDRGWSWWIYEVLHPNTPVMMTIDLRYNKAKRDSRFGAFGSSIKQTEYTWFNFDSFSRSPSGTNSGDFVQFPLFLASLRVAPRMREVAIKYQLFDEMIAEISGSWTFCLACGVLFFLLVQRLLPPEASSSVSPEATCLLAKEEDLLQLKNDLARRGIIPA